MINNDQNTLTLSVEDRISLLEQRIDARFNRIEELLAQYAAGVGTPRQAIEKSPDVNGVVLDQLYDQFVAIHKTNKIVTVNV